MIDSVFDKKTPNWYHHYGVVKLDNPAEENINGLTLVFVELPKVKMNTKEAKKLKILWLRFLDELGEQTKEIPAEFLSVSEIEEMLKLAEKAAYNVGEFENYEHYWKQVSSEKSLKQGAMREGIALMVSKMKARGLSAEIIAEDTGLSIEEINWL